MMHILQGLPFTPPSTSLPFHYLHQQALAQQQAALVQQPVLAHHHSLAQQQLIEAEKQVKPVTHTVECCVTSCYGYSFIHSAAVTRASKTATASSVGFSSTESTRDAIANLRNIWLTLFWNDIFLNIMYTCFLPSVCIIASCVQSKALC